MSRVSFGSRASADIPSSVAEAVVRGTARVTGLSATDSFAAYTEKDVGKLVNENGKLKIVRKGYTSGSAKSVSRNRLDAAEEYFLGIKPLDAPTDGLSDKDFAFFADPATQAYVGFFIYRINAEGVFSGDTGWYPYDPFHPTGNNAPYGNSGEAGKWATEPDSLKAYEGALSFGGPVPDFDAFEEMTTEIGQVFITLDRGRAYYATAVTEAAEDSIYYYAEDVVPLHHCEPTLVLWGIGQDARVETPSSSVNPARDSRSGTGRRPFVFLKWKLSEKLFGANDKMIDILSETEISANASAAYGYSALKSTETSGDREGCFFTLKPGKWRASVSLRSGATSNNQQIRLFKVADGTEDELLAEGLPGTSASGASAGPNHATRFRTLERTAPLDISQGDVLYVTDGNLRNASSNRTQFMQLEYFGP